MRMHFLVILGVVLWVASDGPDDVAKVELKKLDGTWVVKSILRDPPEKTPMREKGSGASSRRGRSWPNSPVRTSPGRGPRYQDLPHQDPQGDGSPAPRGEGRDFGRL
jgi:hypothetical protein